MGVQVKPIDGKNPAQTDPSGKQPIQNLAEKPSFEANSSEMMMGMGVILCQVFATLISMFNELQKLQNKQCTDWANTQLGEHGFIKNLWDSKTTAANKESEGLRSGMWGAFIGAGIGFASAVGMGAFYKFGTLNPSKKLEAELNKATDFQTAVKKPLGGDPTKIAMELKSPKPNANGEIELELKGRTRDEKAAEIAEEMKSGAIWKKEASSYDSGKIYHQDAINKLKQNRVEAKEALENAEKHIRTLQEKTGRLQGRYGNLSQGIYITNQAGGQAGTAGGQFAQAKAAQAKGAADAETTVTQSQQNTAQTHQDTSKRNAEASLEAARQFAQQLSSALQAQTKAQ